MSNFLQRAITGVIFVIVLLGSISYGAASFTLLFSLVTVLGVWEFFKLSNSVDIYPQRILITIVSGIFFLLTSLVCSSVLDLKYMIIVLPLIFLPFLIELYSKSDTPFTNIAFGLLGFFYVAVPFGFLNILAFYPSYDGQYTSHIVLGSFFILWASDTGAYLSGRTLGKHKLFERISPKKTWEGSIGGAIVSCGAAAIVSIFFNELTMIQWIIVSIIIVITGTMGDLVESMFKRSINVKDSGSILPGHGGILDRFDGLLISVPFVVAYLLLFK